MKYFIAFAVKRPGNAEDSNTTFDNTVIERQDPIYSNSDIKMLEADILKKIPMNMKCDVTIISFQRLEATPD